MKLKNLITFLVFIILSTPIYALTNEDILRNTPHKEHIINGNEYVGDIDRIYAGEIYVKGCIERDCKPATEQGLEIPETTNPIVSLNKRYNIDIPLGRCPKPDISYSVSRVFFQIDPSYLEWDSSTHKMGKDTFDFTNNCAIISEKQLILYERIPCTKDTDCLNPRYMHEGICGTDNNCLYVVDGQTYSINKTKSVEVVSIVQEEKLSLTFIIISSIIIILLISIIIYLIKKKRWNNETL